jgi:hypothetical protein
VVYGWVNLARALHGSGDDAEALDAVMVAEEILRGANLPAGHPDFARTELIRGQITASMGNRDEAERRMRNALAIRRARLAPGSTHTADVATALGDLLMGQQRFAAAESLYVAALGPYRTTFGASDPRTVKVQRQLQSICESERRQAACAKLDSTTVPPAR